MGKFGQKVIYLVAVLFMFSFIPDDAKGQSKSLSDVVEALESWIDRETDLPRRKYAPNIIFADSESAVDASEPAMAIGRNTRGFYDPDTAKIILVSPWSAENPNDQSVLLHELVHHRQSAAIWTCPGAMEHPAYKLQERWLNQFNLALDVNWIAIVLAANCAPRDFHPD
ncbi:MAG: DUF6647 family protein [Paracoccaceae bacterium]